MMTPPQRLVACGALVVLAIGGGLYAAGVFDYFSMRAYSERWDAKRARAQQGADAATPATPNDLASAPEAETMAPAGPGVAFVPPLETAIPSGPFGDVIRLGREIFVDTPRAAPLYVGNSLRCVSCHLDAGRLADSSPLWAAFVSYPAYRSKTQSVTTFQQRLQGCFEYSMNGRPPPLGAPELVALESYAYWLATGAPVDPSMAGRGYPALEAPAQPADFVRGEKVYADSCVLCHGADGAGQRTPSGYAVFPALWGADSFNWGAGMGRISNAAGFIKANMPLGLSGMLTDQQAWDVALYMNSHERPQDPRYTGKVQATRDDFHDTEDSMYGRRVAGLVLGATGPPKPFRPSSAIQTRAGGP